MSNQPRPRHRFRRSHRARSESIHLLRELTGRSYALLAGRGAAGIWAALRALGLRDDYVLIPANTCYIVLWAVLKSGNKPLLVDVDAENPSAFSLQPAASEPPGQREDSERKPKAVIPCHMYGLPAPMEAICTWARANDVYVIEDAALAIGATVDGMPAGSWGDVSIFSFGLGKITDQQVGGAALTGDERLAADMGGLLDELPLWDDRLLALTNQWNALYWALHQYESANPRLLELYPALYSIYGELTGYRLSPPDWDELPGLLRQLPANLEHRRAMTELYDDLLRGLPVRTLPRPDSAALWRYPLLVEAARRDDLLQYLWENGAADVTRWYPSLRHMAAALAPDIPQPPTPNADRLADSILNLRLDPGVDRAYVQRLYALIGQYFEVAST